MSLAVIVYVVYSEELMMCFTTTGAAPSITGNDVRFKFTTITKRSSLMVSFVMLGFIVIPSIFTQSTRSFLRVGEYACLWWLGSDHLNVPVLMKIRCSIARV